MDVQPATERLSRRATGHARVRPGGVDRGRITDPGLDVDDRSDDALGAPSLHTGRSTTGLRAANTRPVTYLWLARCRRSVSQTALPPSTMIREKSTYAMGDGAPAHASPSSRWFMIDGEAGIRLGRQHLQGLSRQQPLEDHAPQRRRVSPPLLYARASAGLHATTELRLAREQSSREEPRAVPRAPRRSSAEALA